MPSILAQTLIFQSTLLMRGATRAEKRLAKAQNFNPRSSCEERPQERSSRFSTTNFNPRSSCEERHVQIPMCCVRLYHFNPRSSCEERRRWLSFNGMARHISIHAPHARSDLHLVEALHVLGGISIHAPHARSDLFLPQSSRAEKISIHAPHARSDVLNL